MVTRVIQLQPGAKRENATNAATIFARGVEVVRASHAALFARYRAELARVVGTYDRFGVAAIAVGSGTGVAGHLWLEASEELRAGVVGRHGQAHLFLPGDNDLSLRHMLIAVRMAQGHVRVRVIDLRTPSGFEDEAGKRLAGVAAEGPVFVGAGRYQFFLFPTGGLLPWDDAAEDAWETLPPRVYVDARPGSAPQLAPELPRRKPGSVTVVQVTGGPLGAASHALVESDEAPLGHLVVGSGGFEERIAVGTAAFDRGILLGRYRRCDSAGLSAFADDRISRVHALALRDAGSLYLVDLCSTNGVWVDDREVHMHRLVAGEVVGLGSRTRLRWEPSAS